MKINGLIFIQLLILLIHKISVRQATKITMRLRQVALILNVLRALHRRTLSRAAPITLVAERGRLPLALQS